MSNSVEDTWRTGRTVGRTIYCDDKLIGVMDTPEMATLAAAAPELYRALTEICEWFSVESSRHLEVLSAARAALAKARGE